MRPRALAAAAAVLLSAGAATGAPGRRPRYKSLKPARASAPARRSLAPGRWAPAVREALDALIETRGDASRGYAVDRPPVAVLVWDDVAAGGSFAEAAFARRVDRAEFKFSREFWSQLPAPLDRRAEVGWEGFHAHPRAGWPRDADYQMYRKAMFSSREAVYRDWGRRRCAVWLVGLLAGFPEAELAAYSKIVLDEALAAGPGEDEVLESAGDERPIRIRTGLAKIPEMEDLTRTLLARGFDVWVLSASHQWGAEAFAALYGVDESRVVGVRSRVRNKTVVPGQVDPLPVGAGQAEAVSEFIGRSPDLIVGGGAEDKELLEYGSGGVRLLVDRGDEAFRAHAAGRGWLIQPAFTRGPGAR